MAILKNPCNFKVGIPKNFKNAFLATQPYVVAQSTKLQDPNCIFRNTQTLDVSYPLKIPNFLVDELSFDFNLWLLHLVYWLLTAA